jgi:outer membrane protein, heavy metal efflux system
MPIGLGAFRRTAFRVHSTMALAGVLLLWPAHRVQAQDAVPKRPLGPDIPVYLPPLGDVTPRQAPEVRNPSGSLGLRDAITLALLQNPTLASFAWETRAREARLLQVGRHPNPSLSLLLEDIGASQFAGGGVNEPIQPQTTLQLSQLVELGGKRGARQRLAAATRDLAAWDYEAARIDVFTDVTRAFADVLAAQEGVAQIERTSQLVEEVHQSVGLRVTAGVVSPIEQTRAAVTAAAVRADLARARRALEASRVRLGALWGSSTPAFITVEGDLQATPPSLPSLSDLATKVQQNPELARWATELVQREAAVSLERAKGVPDVSVSAGYRRFTEIDANAVVVGATISLPLFDRNRASVNEAQIRLAKGYEERRAAELKVTAALADAYAVLAGAFDEITILRSAVLPGSQQAFEAVSEGYRLGRFGYLDVLEAQRTLIASRAQLHRALADFHKATAHVERLIGAPLSDGASSASVRE